jgi:chloride channel protein, CIC family
MTREDAVEHKPLGEIMLVLLAFSTGVVAGLGAVFFRGLIAFFHNLLFLGVFSFSYDANVHTPDSPWGPLVILAPVAGAIFVAFVVTKFAPEVKGNGIPEVLDATYFHRGVIRPVVALMKVLASAVSIGSGGSVGREGPIVQIGASFGSTLGQVVKMPDWQRTTLISAGAAGGIAATFNTPIGGIIFALELMADEVSVRTFVPIAIATATATYMGQLFFGTHPSFMIPALQSPYFDPYSPEELFAYAGLGVVMGAVSAVLIKSIYGMEDAFARLKGGYYIRHITGMLAVGVVMYTVKVSLGYYYTEGVGYSTVQDILTGSLNQLYILAALSILKLLSTSLTLGSGGSGGIFSPALYLGATIGGLYGIVLGMLFPGIGISPPAFAVAGMAGAVAGSTGAAVTAIVLVYEMTVDYSVMLPMLVVVTLSYGVRRRLCRDSIYTLKLSRRGHHVPDAMRRMN